MFYLYERQREEEERKKWVLFDAVQDDVDDWEWIERRRQRKELEEGGGKVGGTEGETSGEEKGGS